MKNTHVCLILEGTYPYIVGGVSRWVHDLITDLDDIKFSILHLRYGDRPEHAPYTPPHNLNEIVHVPMEKFRDADINSRWWSDFLEIPYADVYHSLATGFAGVLGVQIKRATGRPLLLTEHAIYWREVDKGAEELECGFRIVGTGNRLFGIAANRAHWCSSLKRVAADTYSYADQITTVAQSNIQYQRELGALPERCRVIPNGVNIPSQRSQPRQPHFVFVGRVAPIKDVKTCLLAMAEVRRQRPDSRFSVVGPIHHDPYYGQEMLQLAWKLGFDYDIFPGECDPIPYYLSATALLLTSVSEALPFAALEAMSFEVPIIATDVGDCRVLVHGGPHDNLGDAGFVFPVEAVDSIAGAMLELLRTPGLRSRMGCIARTRIERHYRRESVCSTYRELYLGLASSGDSQVSRSAVYDDTLRTYSGPDNQFRSQ